MKKIFFTLFAFFIINVFLFAQKPNVSISKASGTITLDGVANEWAEIPVNPIEIEVAGSTTIANSYWKALWDDNGIYVLVSVEDDKYYPDYLAGASDHWNYDKPELYFDVNELLEDGLGAENGPQSGHSQLSPPFSELNIDGTSIIDVYGGSKYAHKVTGENYTFEYFIPFYYLDQAIDGTDYTRPIGFDVTILDRDTEEVTTSGKNWSNASSTLHQSWYNSDGCGTITLANYGSIVNPPVLTTEEMLAIALAKIKVLENQHLSDSIIILNLEKKLEKGEYLKYDTIFIDVIEMKEYSTLIETSKGDVSVKLYPNPAKDKVILNSLSNILDYEIINTNGHIIASDEVNSFSASIDLGNCQTGNYYIKITTSNGTIMCKLVLTK